MYIKYDLNTNCHKKSHGPVMMRTWPVATVSFSVICSWYVPSLYARRYQGSWTGRFCSWRSTDRPFLAFGPTNDSILQVEWLLSIWIHACCWVCNFVYIHWLIADHNAAIAYDAYFSHIGKSLASARWLVTSLGANSLCIASIPHLLIHFRNIIKPTWIVRTYCPVLDRMKRSRQRNILHSKLKPGL